MMILISAQIEIERANFACDFDFNRKQQTRLLEGEHECFFKLHKPITFQVTGNKDNVDKNDDHDDDDFYEWWNILKNMIVSSKCTKQILSRLEGWTVFLTQD